MIRFVKNKKDKVFVVIDTNYKQYIFKLNQIVAISDVYKETWPSGYSEARFIVTLKTKDRISIYDTFESKQNIDDTNIKNIRKILIKNVLI